jgi:hypothetical protein
MNEIRFYQRPWFLLSIPPISILIIYALSARDGVSFSYHLGSIVILWILYFILLGVWLAFFAQFVLPVSTFRERWQIFFRLLAYIIGLHGPAIFFRDGEPVKRENEAEKKGPGVLWLDSASGVVTQTPGEFKNTFGPGVHFTKRNEKIAGYVDLHIQTDKIGPATDEDPFAKRSDQQSDIEYATIQRRRYETSALTRDGVEVVANISILFKIDADPVTDQNAPGSRFGFSEEAVRLAVCGQPINSSMPKDSHLYHVPWNQIPAILAPNVWRDLLSKFTIKDLFERRFSYPPSISNIPPSTASTNTTGVNLIPSRGPARLMANIISAINGSLSGLSDSLETLYIPPVNANSQSTPPAVQQAPKDSKVTGLQLINFMIKEQLQKQNVPSLDRYGEYVPGSRQYSEEYEFLKCRGIRILTVSVSNLRFTPEVNKKWLEGWLATWLSRAQDEKRRLILQESYQHILNEQNTLLVYIYLLSSDLLNQKRRGLASNLPATLRALLLESRFILIRETQHFRQSSPEREEIESILQWLEKRYP